MTERLATFTMPTAEQVKAVLPRFMGRITQTPSAYSAIKINGQRACDRMRQGEQVEMPSREVVIHRLELLACRTADHTLLLDVDCSRGTYIRSLCTDLGQALGIPAVMTFLVRTRVGDFRLADALTLEELAEKGRVVRPYLGVSLLDQTLAKRLGFDLDLRGGLFVVKMFQDGPAYRGGIRPNDIIVKFNGTKVDSVAALRDALGKCQVGQQVPVTILRGDEEVNKTVTLTEMPQQSSRQ